jgi:hypothetical protein
VSHLGVSVVVQFAVTRPRWVVVESAAGIRSGWWGNLAEGNMRRGRTASSVLKVRLSTIRRRAQGLHAGVRCRVWIAGDTLAMKVDLFCWCRI